MPQNAKPKKHPWLGLVLVGIASGFVAGLVGVGGGLIIIPLLTVWYRFNQREAVGVSLAVIVPTAIIGVFSYAADGQIDLIAAALLAVGIIPGAQIGTVLLHRINATSLKLIFIAFMIFSIVMLWVNIPSRESNIEINPFTGSMFVVTGLLIGILSGVIGVGGGGVAVPVLMIFFGSGDLVAKGTSLAMMIPGSLSGALGNLRRKNLNLRTAGLVSLGAIPATPLGSWLAHTLNPVTGNILLTLLLTYSAASMLYKMRKK